VTVLDPRIARSREVIVAAATRHFQRVGYVGASVDDIAAEARVSKRTVYNIFGSKEQLFRETLSEAITIAEEFATKAASVLADSQDVEADLRTIASTFAPAVLGGPVVGLRRLVIGEAERFPEIAREYYERAAGRVLDMLADAMRRFGDNGLLDIEDPRLASEHFAFLVMGPALDHALFRGTDEPPPVDEIDVLGDRGMGYDRVASDRGVGVALGHEGEHLAFPRRQPLAGDRGVCRVRSGRRAPGRPR
jgi:TetR/AcrR family transcriptional repressor of mexJK operon